MTVDTLYGHGFVRAAIGAPRMALADPAANATETIRLAREADAAGAALLLLPELGLSGYSLDDLHMQASLQRATLAALESVRAASAGLTPVIAVGAALRIEGALYNCAVIVHRGRVLGVTPKSYLPNYREFYEKRQFASAADAAFNSIPLFGGEVPFGTDLLFRAGDVADLTLAFEICEDLWAAAPPSSFAALAGATVIGNLSASNVTIGKAQTRRRLCATQSERCMAAYLYSAAGRGESTTDLAWDGQACAYELGEKLGESPRFADGSTLLLVDVDVERLAQERLRTPTFRDGARLNRQPVRIVSFTLAPPLDRPLPLSRQPARFPFVPDDPARLDEDCFEATSIQVQGLRQRLDATGLKKAVIGVSGGLDSTQALLVTARAFDLMGRPRSDIVAVTMPGFATGAASKANAWALMRELNVDAREVDIRPLATRMLEDLGHPAAKGAAVYDVTYENVQAGVRTDYLFRLANQEGGLVVGTGDLSEIALGWSTYGVGDHMSHYNVNCSAPKTLIQHLIRWAAGSGHYAPAVGETLRAILAAEISPELVPADASGAVQSTEGTIGPYALHDFFLFYATRFGFGPAKILYLAERAWGDPERGEWPQAIAPADRRGFTRAEILRWLEVFTRRFYATSQFKRSASPNGPKLSSGGALSPRGDWRAPSDNSAAPWLEELARLKG